MSEALEERMTRLERKLRRSQFLGLGALLAAVASVGVVVVEWRTPTEIRARAFSLVARSGEELARLADSPGGPLLLVHAKQAGADVVLGSLNGDAGLGIVAQGVTVVTLASGKNGTSLGLHGKGKSRLLAGLAGAVGDSPTLSLWDEGGRTRLMLGLAVLRLRDENGKLIYSVPTMKE